jgi:hypothetical protein
LVSQSLLKGQSFIKVKHFCCFGFAVNWWGAYGGLAFELMSLAKKKKLVFVVRHQDVSVIRAPFLK